MIPKFFLILIVECDKYCNWIRDPICGSDGTTYSNKCHMEVAACKSDSDITIKHPGECRDYEADCGSMSILLCILVDFFSIKLTYLNILMS